jgi:hypothetical protein
VNPRCCTSPSETVPRARPDLRRGFVLPLALFMLLVIALLTAILLEGAVQELRTARGGVAAARAAAAAGSGLTTLLVSRPDSTTLVRPRGSLSAATTVSGAETTAVTLQSLGSGTFRAVSSARVWYGGVRADASVLGLIRILPDSAGPPGSLRYGRLPGWWWAPLP